MARKCLDEVLAAAEAKGMKLPGKEAESILDNIEGVIKRNNLKIKSQSDLDAVIEEALEMAKTAKIIAARRRNNALRNAKIHAKLINTIRTTEQNPYKVLRGIMVGNAKMHNMLSIDAESRTAIADLQSQLLIGLEKNDLTEAAKKGIYDKEVHMALHPKEGEEPNVSNEAKLIAKIIRRVQDYTLSRKNRAGAYINKLENYITRQSHDAKLMSDAGYEKWRDDITPLLDDSTYKDVVPRKDGKDAQEEFLKETYNSLISGIHKRSDGEYTINGKKDPITSFTGQSNLAKSLSQSRVLHFKDGEAAFQYSEKYNRRNLFETIIDGLTHDGRSIALMENLGTNPRMMIERILDDIDAKAASDPTMKTSKWQRNAAMKEFAQLDNSLNAVGISEGVFFGADFQSVASGFRMIQETAYLGGATVASITDVASKAAFLASNTERGFFNNFGTALKDIFEGLRGPERKEFAIRLLVGVEGMTGNVLSRHGPEDFGPGFISKMHALFFKLNGMRYWNHAQKVGVARVLAFDGAASVKKQWKDIDSSFKNFLEKYDINEKELKLFKDVDMKAKDGREYLFPDLADDIPTNALDLYIRDKTGTMDITDNMRASTRDELRTKIGTLYTDGADTAIPTPGAKERAIMNQGYAKGTIGGEVIRMIMMLKGFPITMITKGLTRQYYTSGFTGTMKMIAGMSAMGYVAMSAKDILKGKEPKTIFSDDYMKSAKVITASMVQGGGMGIFGDFMFGEFNRYGQSFTKTLAGPAFGVADDLASLFQKFVRGDDAAKDAVKFAMRNTPFSNLFYTRVAADYMVLHGLMETMDPGYLTKMERRYKKDYDQEYYFPPSQYAQRF